MKYRRKFILFFILLISSHAVAGEWIWKETPPPATLDQPVLLLFYTPQTENWPEIQSYFQNPTLSALAESFYCYRVDLLQQPYTPIAVKYKVYRPSTLVLLNSEGAIHKIFEGAFSLNQLLTEMGQLVSSPQPVSSDSQQNKSEPVLHWISLCQDRKDVPSGERDLIEAQYAIQDGQLWLLVRFAGRAEIDGFHFCLNSDRRKDTGFLSTNLSGYDRMIEGGTLYSFSGSKQDEWAWEPLKTLTYTIGDQSLTLSIPLNDLGLELSNSYSCAFNTSNRNWETVDWMPDAEPAILQLKK